MGCVSIAFPLLASGNNGYDLELAFQIAKESIESFSGSNIKRVVLVLFGDHIASIVRRQGYKVIQIPENVKKEELKQAHKTKAKKIADDSKELAQIILEEQLQKGLDYLKKEKNREKIVDEGAAVVKLVFQIWKKATE